jgi:hypothetical protein
MQVPVGLVALQLQCSVCGSGCKFMSNSVDACRHLPHCVVVVALSPVVYVQALDSRHMANFLLKAPDALFTSCTQAQALQVRTAAWRHMMFHSIV